MGRAGESGRLKYPKQPAVADDVIRGTTTVSHGAFRAIASTFSASKPFYGPECSPASPPRVHLRGGAIDGRERVARYALAVAADVCGRRDRVCRQNDAVARAQHHRRDNRRGYGHGTERRTQPGSALHRGRRRTHLLAPTAAAAAVYRGVGYAEHPGTGSGECGRDVRHHFNARSAAVAVGVEHHPGGLDRAHQPGTVPIHAARAAAAHAHQPLHQAHLLPTILWRGDAR
eukprot:ctg_1835.g530